jgi:hypothetical protein
MLPATLQAQAADARVLTRLQAILARPGAPSARRLPPGCPAWLLARPIPAPERPLGRRDLDGLNWMSRSYRESLRVTSPADAYSADEAPHKSGEGDA